MSANPHIKLDSVKVKWVVEKYPDLSWLETTLEDGQIIDSCRYTQEGYDANPVHTEQWIREDHQRLAQHGNTWIMQGCYATAQIWVKMNGHSITQTIRSGGLYGIESDSNTEHKKEIEAQQLEELKDILDKMNIDTIQYNHLSTPPQPKHITQLHMRNKRTNPFHKQGRF